MQRSGSARSEVPQAARVGVEENSLNAFIRDAQQKRSKGCPGRKTRALVGH
jgi:hypothetical protein